MTGRCNFSIKTQVFHKKAMQLRKIRSDLCAVPHTPICFCLLRLLCMHHFVSMEKAVGESVQITFRIWKVNFSHANAQKKKEKKNKINTKPVGG